MLDNGVPTAFETSIEEMMSTELGLQYDMSDQDEMKEFFEEFTPRVIKNLLPKVEKWHNDIVDGIRSRAKNKSKKR